MSSFDLNSVDWQRISRHPALLLSAVPSLVLYLCNLINKDATTVFALVTANTLITNTYVWNIVTSCFFETNILKILSNVVSAAMIANVLIITNIEQFALLTLFTVLACSIGTSVYCFFSFASLGKEELLVTPIYGFNGILVMLLMMTRQQQGRQSLYKEIPWLTYHHSPLILVLFQLFFWCMGIKAFSTDLAFSIIALFFSWSYLRFFYKVSDTEFGDKSDEFTFVMMFPEKLHIILIPFTTAFYNIVALLGVFPVLDTIPEKKHHHHLRHDESTPLVAATSPSTEKDLVAQRRRAKAMKLLDQKMAEMSQLEKADGWDDDLANAVSSVYGDLDAVTSAKIESAKLKV